MAESASETIPGGGSLAGVGKLNSTYVVKTFRSGKQSLDRLSDDMP